MTIVAGWAEGTAERQTSKARGLERFTRILQKWQDEMARRRFIALVLRETRDPRILADLGIEMPREDEIERMIATMVWHQH